MKNSIGIFVCVIMSINNYAQTQRITFKQPYLYPEGTAYNNSKNIFYVSSVKTGDIGTVDNTGNYKVLYSDTSLKSTFGMKVDEKRNRLWFCAGNPNKLYSEYSDSATLKKMIRLIAVDLTNGKKAADIDLSNLYEGKHFANDLTLDDNGNVYITDSYSPVIYKVDANGKATLFATNDLFKGEDIGLNGIVYSPQGFLLVVNNSNGSLLKIDVNDPAKVSMVKLKTFMPGADGLLWNTDRNLVLVQNKGINKISQLSSNDNWVTAQVKAATAMEDRFAYPSTATMMNGKVYVLNAKLNELQDSTLPHSKEFSLQLVMWKPM